ncbi:MAG: hypothetical protein WAL63_15685 [Solirubrobacteraceae bacterium]
MVWIDPGVRPQRQAGRWRGGDVAALEGPFADLRIIPTGGVTAENASAYLGRRSVVAVGGSWMVSPALAGAGDFETVTKLAAQAVALAAEARS